MTKRLHELVAFYLKWHEIEGHTRDTIYGYRVDLRLFLRFLGGDRLVSDVSALDVLGFLGKDKERGLRPRTIRTHFQRVTTFLKWAVEWGVLEVNPAEKMRPPKVPKTRKGFLKPEAFRALLDLCPLSTFLGARRQLMLWLFATTGMRHMELAALTLEDLDAKAGIVTVRMGKGQKERRVPFHREAQRAELLYQARRTDRLPSLWVTQQGQRLTYLGIGQDMRRLMERAGIKDQVEDTCHIFRRTWAANAVRQGIPRQYAQAIGGWSTPQMLDHYTAAMMEEEGAIEAFRDFDPFGGR